MGKHSLRRFYVLIVLGKEVRKSLAFSESHHGLPRGWKCTNEEGSAVFSVEKPLSIFWLQKASSLWRSVPALFQVILKRSVIISFAMVMLPRLAQIYPPYWGPGVSPGGGCMTHVSPFAFFLGINIQHSSEKRAVFLVWAPSAGMMGPSSYINTHNLPTHHFTWKMLIHIKKKMWPVSGKRLPRWLSGKESACQCKRCRRHMFNP